MLWKVLTRNLMKLSRPMLLQWKKESEITKLKETAGAVLEHSNAMEEVGNDGEADLAEEEKNQLKCPKTR